MMNRCEYWCTCQDHTVSGVMEVCTASYDDQVMKIRTHIRVALFHGGKEDKHSFAAI